MAAQQLNVRVGLLFDEKSLANIERQMRSSGQRLSKIGTDLSLSLSLPLAAFGATAIKSAGDIESLTLALKSQLGTADAAAKELEALTEAAKNPGLGVEQAVRGSVRLQGVGFAAEEARQVLIQMGNAIAATGGTAQELDNVTRQFAQMTSKGRVLQEDVSILSENMPGLAQLMQKAFGTQSVEAIRDMGITGKEFVKQVTKAAEELPRVEGGIKNGIGNAIDSLKQSAAKVGLAINQAFNVTGAIESVSSAVLALAQGFSALPDPIQKVILGFAALAIATGPVVSAYGAIQLMGSRLVAGWGLVVGAIKPVIAAFNALSLATRAFILVGVVVAVLSFIDAFSQYQSQLSDTEKAQASLLNIQKQAADSIQGQKSEVDTLVAAYQAEGATLKQKEQILGRLNQISPEYFSKLRVGKGDVEALTIATAAYGKQLLVVAELSSLNKRLEQIATDLRNVEDAAEPSALESIGNAVLSAGNSFLFAANQSKTFAENSKEITAALTEEQAALQKRATELALGAAATDNLSDKYKNLGGASDETKEKLKTLKEVLEDVKNASIKASLIGDDADQAKIEALQKGIVRLIDSGFKPASAEVLNLKTQLDRLNEKPTDVVINIIKKEGGGGVADLAGGGPIPQAAPNLQPVDVVPAITAATVALEKHQKAQKEVAEWQEKLNLGQIDFTESLGPLISSLAASGDIMKASFVAMGDAIAQSAASGETSLQKLGQAAVGAAAKIVRAYIQQGVAAAVAKALSGLPFPLNLAAGAAAGGLAAALFTKAIGSIGVKGFAKGTNFAPGGVALVGEQGPELINLPRGSQVFPTPQTNKMLSGMGGNSMSLDGEFTVRGTDLVLVLDRANRKNDRLR